METFTKGASVGGRLVTQELGLNLRTPWQLLAVVDPEAGGGAGWTHPAGAGANSRNLSDRTEIPMHSRESSLWLLPLVACMLRRVDYQHERYHEIVRNKARGYCVERVRRGSWF